MLDFVSKFTRAQVATLLSKPGTTAGERLFFIDADNNDQLTVATVDVVGTITYKSESQGAIPRLSAAEAENRVNSFDTTTNALLFRDSGASNQLKLAYLQGSTVEFLSIDTTEDAEPGQIKQLSQSAANALVQAFSTATDGLLFRDSDNSDAFTLATRNGASSDYATFGLPYTEAAFTLEGLPPSSTEIFNNTNYVFTLNTSLTGSGILRLDITQPGGAIGDVDPSNMIISLYNDPYDNFTSINLLPSTVDINAALVSSVANFVQLTGYAIDPGVSANANIDVINARLSIKILP